MSRLVYDPLSNDPVLVAPERGERPGAWAGSPAVSCPFCPGHEDETPPELSRRGDGRWSARVVPNKFPAVAPIDGIPSHEVLIDSEEHVSPLELRRLDSLTATVELWRERYARHYSREGIESVILFRNEGRAAGQSIDHPHSQLLALPFVPPRLAAESRAFSVADACPLCSPPCDELMIARLHGLEIRSPLAPRLAFESWIVPATHQPDWLAADAESIARALQLAILALRSRLPGAAFNLALSSVPPRAPEPGAFHWHLEVLPRLTGIAGFELATGSWMNIVDPATAAAGLRDALRRAGA